MDEKQIRKYAELMREMGLTGLEINEEGMSVRLEISAPPQSVAISAPAPTPVLSAATSHEALPAPSQDEQPADMEDICSPMVGVFYSAPAENASPYVQIGDKVKKGDVLCIIEAMKLMNEIKAEVDGEILDICVGNNQIVDFGHVLFRIRKES